MWLSTKTRYGLKAMHEISLHYGDKPISLNTISSKYDISLSYLEQIIALLRKKDLIKSTRGIYGGYSLAYPPENINIGDIIRALEGSYAPTECVEENEPCEQQTTCVTYYVFKKINNSITKVVDNLTLKDLIDEKL